MNSNANKSVAIKIESYSKCTQEADKEQESPQTRMPPITTYPPTLLECTAVGERDSPKRVMRRSRGVSVAAGIKYLCGLSEIMTPDGREVPSCAESL